MVFPVMVALKRRLLLRIPPREIPVTVVLYSTAGVLDVPNFECRHSY
jgi:hypothetical protein